MSKKDKKPLSLEERKQIESLNMQGVSASDIGRLLSRRQSVISYELRRFPAGKYFAETAQLNARKHAQLHSTIQLENALYKGTLNERLDVLEGKLDALICQVEIILESIEGVNGHDIH
jgi:IS30 family transposase